MQVLDAGCGRGELVLHSAIRRARSIGIDISADAINICNSTLSFWKKEFPWVERFAEFQKMDVVQIDFEKTSFDVVFLSDVVEHLESESLEKLLRKIKKVLKSRGKLIIHTSPNKYYIPVTGGLFSIISRILNPFNKSENHIIPWNIRKVLPRGLQSDVHLNELSSFSIRRVLKKAGLKAERIWFELNPHYIDHLFSDKRGFQIINRIKRIIPLKHLFYADLYCIARPNRLDKVF